MTNTETTDKTAAVAPEKAPSKKGASQKQDAPKAKKTAKGAIGGASAKASKKAAKPERKATAPRAGAKILETRAKGATLAEIMKATNWQAHSVRGFVSTASKKRGVKIESAKNDAGERTYKIAK